MIVGFVGYKDHGKGTAGEVLVQKGFTAESFAKPIKDSCAAIFNWDRALLEGDTKESRIFREQEDFYWTEKFGFSVTPRYMMQLIGTESSREAIHYDIWIAALEKRIQDRSVLNGILRQEENYVITDVRFPNEIDQIHSMDGMVIWVKRNPLPDYHEQAQIYNDWIRDSTNPLAVGFGTLPEPPKPADHISEWAWVGYEFDHVIDNDGTVDDLKAKIDKLFH